MRANEFLTEKARGLLYRKPGDTFKSPQGQEIQFSQVAYLPDQPGAYATREELDVDIERLKTKYPQIVFVNQPTASTKGMAILEFQDVDTDDKLYFARFFNEILQNMESKWPNNGLPGNWQLQAKSSLKASYKLKPSDIFPAGSKFNNPRAVLAAMTHSASGESYAEPSMALLKRQLPVYPDAAAMEPAIRDELGEILAPVALLLGMITDPQAEQARQHLLGNGAWSGGISFPQSKISNLIDSEIHLADGTTLGISSKGNQGATASIKNVYDGMLKLKQQKSPILRNYKDVADILTDIATASSLDGPFVLAKRFNIIDDNFEQTVKQLISSNATDLSQVRNRAMLAQLQSYIDRLNAKLNNPSYNVGYHILAVLAADVARQASTSKFSNACQKFLNSAPILQIHMQTKASKDGSVAVTGFHAIYPPSFTGNVMLDASKVYYATGINGRFTFKYLA